MFGATILAVVTALPEISSGLRAVRLGRVGLAMGDIFGGNQVQMTLFLLADLLAGKPVLQTVTTSSTWLAGIGVIVTAIYAVGFDRPPAAQDRRTRSRLLARVRVLRVRHRRARSASRASGATGARR